MAKRFTDTDKWKDDWYLSLTNDQKVVWTYLNDNCSLAGIIKKGIKHLNYFCGTNFSEADLLLIFKGKMVDLEDSFFLPSFILEQYPSGLKSDKPLIVSVRKEIESSNHSLIIRQSLPNHYSMIDQSLDNDKTIIRERVREKEREKVKEEEGSAEGRLYKESMTLYYEFIKEKTGVPPNINAVEGKSLKSILAYLKQINPDESKILEGWKAILDNFVKWDAFLQKQLKLIQISSNLTNIIHSIKNGKQNTKREITNDDIAEEIRKRYPDSVR